ncbi:MAG: MipA/OmpV family protein [Bosea sp. (in: a-proteobacteria)]
MRHVLAVAILLSASAPALAQSPLSSESATNWNLTIGAGVRYQPDYQGSDDYVFSPRPIIRLGRGLGSKWHSTEDDSISIGLTQGENWRVGVAGAFLFERLESRNPALRGLGKVGYGAELGGFGEYYIAPWLRARADLRRGFGAHQAFMTDLKLDVFGKLSPAWSFSVGPRLSLAGRDYVQTYYGIDAVQSARSGLPAQRMQGGLQSAGALGQVTYQWSPRVQSTAYVEYKRVLGDAAKSPIVKRFGSADSVTLGFSTTWAIDLGR